MSKKLIIYIITSIVILGIGITYAWITWGSEENTAVEFTIGNVADVVFSEGTDITSDDFAPTLTSEKGEYLTFSIKNRSKYPYNVKVSILPETFPTELAEESLKYEVYRGNSEENINNKISEGNFLNTVEGTEFTVAEEIEITSGTTYFKVVIWIDGNMDNPLDMRNQRMVLKVNVDAELRNVANAPELFEGLIPIKWDENNTVVKADVTNPMDDEWYNYNEKEWANAVMVSSDTRESYMNAEAGSAITTSDILGYWVWIPRYRYELFNTEFNQATYTDGVCTANCPQTIKVVFESSDTVKSDGSANGEWLTHPAFTFGDTELSGFWVAKFEPSSDVTCTAASNSIVVESGCNLTTINPKVLPGVTSWRGAQINTQFIVNQKFMSETYLTTNGVALVDSHMMKNMEWGAVAFLSHSVYGKNAEITINNNGDSYYTGGGIGTSYITNGGQSTTGNITGIYDMSGNAWEYVMGNLNNISANSGLTVTSIDEKYVDIYQNPTNNQYDYSGSKLGDAAGETIYWYSDNNLFVYSNVTWFERGCFYNAGASAGIFAIGRSDAVAHYIATFRPIISAK